MAEIKKRWIFSSGDMYFCVMQLTDGWMGGRDWVAAEAEKIVRNGIDKGHRVTIKMLRDWLELSSRDNLLYLSDIPNDLREIIYNDFQPIKLKCICGAAKTSNPNCHSDWCDLSYTNRR